MDDHEAQRREVAERTARRAIDLITRGKPIDVCYRSLVAAANALVSEDGQEVEQGQLLPLGGNGLSTDSVEEYSKPSKIERLQKLLEETKWLLESELEERSGR